MQNLGVYLNDHLAGSVGALELMDHLIEASEGSEFTLFLTTLRKDIEADQRVLEKLLLQTGEPQSAVRKAGAWIMEKISRSKLEPSAKDNWLGLFQALEALSLGITGKRALWRTLAAAEGAVPELRGLDYSHLGQRATEQIGRVEAKCSELAASVLSSQ